MAESLYLVLKLREGQRQQSNQGTGPFDITPPWSHNSYFTLANLYSRVSCGEYCNQLRKHFNSQPYNGWLRCFQLRLCFPFRTVHTEIVYYKSMQTLFQICRKYEIPTDERSNARRNKLIVCFQVQDELQ